MKHVYVTGHRNPDLDSIASAIGYAELKQKLHPGDTYAPARLGDPNPQTEWALKKSGARAPKFVPHIMLRVKDVMNQDVITSNWNDPIRDAGLAMARRGISQIPIVDDRGVLVGIITERDLARMYIRESREPSTFAHSPVSVSSIVSVLEGELAAGGDQQVAGRLWVTAMSLESMGKAMGSGDIVVVGDRPEAQLRALELGISVLVITNGAHPEREVVERAKEQGASVVRSPLDSYVTSRMIQLAVPCRTVMSEDPLTVGPEELISDITDQVMEVHYRGAVAVDSGNRPIGIVTRTDLVNPEPRRVLLVDHAERGQSIPGVDQAHIEEILDHHHIGDIQTKVPVAATFDPVGSTSTLVMERFRLHGIEPERSTAMMLLAAILSDTVILNSPTTTDRDRKVVRHLEEMLGVDAEEFGREMFEESSDVSRLSAEKLISRDSKTYQLASGDEICIAQVETVGTALLERKDELLRALEEARRSSGYLLYALMITDIAEQGTKLLLAGDAAPVEKAFNTKMKDNVIDLPGVMSRKKQVAPKLI
ncbi:putative manganese-dependent inorganic diphosphatase [Rubrobacter taiwanensis]|uniref:putative manganese-dependent inorganic diphosphatase n=1 Tax=Rubrobacter taiwanensis TaxID=185139 RepID=UPI0014042FD6|nr:putative manganese-dependent inorganic diphosphatase [Rubrobacter taiwanensis]